MPADWSRAIRREYAGGDARFELPVRPLGWGRLIGLFLVGFGVLFLWSPAHDGWRTLQKWLHETPGGMDTFSCLFSLPFLIGGCVPLAIGLLILFGRCRVEWKDGQLRSAEILGPLRWTRRLPRKPVRKLEVSAATSKPGNSPPRQLENFSSLAAEFEDGSKKLIVLGYPKDWLLALAQELKAYVGGSAFSAAAAEVEVIEKPLADADADDVLEQPAGSRVQVEERGAGVRLVVPPAGLWRGSWGLFFFALVWCGFMVFFTTLTGASMFKGGGIEWGLMAFLAAFWAIGIGLLVGAIHMGRRSATLEADAGRLRVETRGLFGTKQREWPRAELSAIRAGASGIEVNERPVIELQVHPSSGKKVGLLGGRKGDELRWLATRLRRALNVPARKNSVKMVPATGLEPVRCYPLEPESSASANSATRA